jgi:hypothetical protein
MTGLTDIARFRVDDPDELVAASLVCPLCLRGDEVSWQLDAEDGYDPLARCTCGDCGRAWRVYLAPQQALRLSLAPVHAA